jgi:hypothetical protein
MATRYEYSTTWNSAGDDDRFGGNHWRCQSFTPDTVHGAYSVKLRLERGMLPETVTVSIRATDGTGKPTGSDLCSGTTNGNTLPSGSSELREIFFTTNPTLSAGTKYAYVVRVTNSNSLQWYLNNDVYPDGNSGFSGNSGSTWFDGGTDFVFEDWGVAPVPTDVLLTGQADGVSSAESSVVLVFIIAGVSDGTSTAVGDLSIAGQVDLLGQSDGTSTTTAAIQVVSSIPPLTENASYFPVMGLFNYQELGEKTLLALNTRYINKYNATTKLFEDYSKNLLHFKSTSQTILPVTGNIVRGITSGAYGNIKAVFTEHGAAGTADGWIVFDELVWVFPIGHSDPDSGWTSETNAYDGNVTTYASTYVGGGEYSPYLYLSVGSTIQCDKIRFWDVHQTGYFIEVEVYDTDLALWISLPETFSWTTKWVEIDFGVTRNINQARIRVFNDGSVGYGRLYDFAFSVAGQSNYSVAGTFTDTETLVNGSSPTNIFGVADGANFENIFSGTDLDFFNFCQWKKIAYILNNVDIIRKYDGDQNACVPVYIDLDVEGGPDNDVDTARLMFVVEGRLVLLDTTERGIRYPRRARWSDVNDPTTWADADYKDCSDTSDEILSAKIIQNILYVYFKGKTGGSIWRLSYTGDSTDPFRWDCVVPQEGIYAPMSLVDRKGIVYGLGRTRFTAFNGLSLNNADEKIPDVILTWNKNAIAYCYGFDRENMSQIWESYVSSGATKPDSILVFNYEDGSYSDYNVSAHCFGSAEVSDNLILDDLDDGFSLDDYPDGFSLDDESIQAGYPLTLFGDRMGGVYQFDETQSDYNTAIAFEATTGRLNPYIEGGHKARLHWIDFLVDNDSTVDFDVSLYLNYDEVPYRTTNISCYDASKEASDKVWKRLFVNCIGDFHQWKLSNNDTSNTPRIHCMIPYFTPAGSQ